MTGQSKARRYLSRLAEESGADRVLVVPKSEPGVEGADLVPGSALRWPPCECGHPRCPDYVPPEQAAGKLGALVAECDGRSRKSGL
ncbi:hypothetical protein [Streptomyces sp. NPDC088725]|uniref:hypothetical protein n=1 Tax=Streptomyces sp. NPDC088725 TaxID=3365873 RepID=UPI00381DB3D9